MKLNNTSYVHKKIRLLCFQLEALTGLKRTTNLDEEFTQIRFMNSLSYIVIDFKKSVCFSMSYSMNKAELETADDIMLYCQWLMLGEKTALKLDKKKKKSSKKN